MEKKINRITVFLSAITILFIGWLVYSYYIVPLSVEHGYFVTAAKLMAQGFVPWQDFSIEDTPLGIVFFALVYKLFGIETSSYLASWGILIFHLLNMFLLWKALMKLLGRKVDALLGLAFYSSIIYSTDALMMNMEPLAVFFILLGINLLFRDSGSRTALTISGGMFALAVCCKAQAVFLLPVVLFMIDRIKLCRFVVSFIIFSIVFYIIIGWLSDDFSWISNIQWTNWKSFDSTDIYSIVMNFAILAGRCSLFFLLLYRVLGKELDENEKKLALMGFAAYISICILFIMRGSMAYAMMAYPFITISAVVLVRKIKKYMFLMILSLFVFPTALAVREFNKLDWGIVKQNQMEELDVVKMVLEDCNKVLFIGDECMEFDLGPQIFAEIPHLKPVNLRTSKFGMEKFIDEYNDFSEVVNNADCIIIGELSYRIVFTNEFLSLEEDVLDYMENIGTASLTILKRTEDTPKYSL